MRPRKSTARTLAVLTLTTAPVALATGLGGGSASAAPLGHGHGQRDAASAVRVYSTDVQPLATIGGDRDQGRRLRLVVDAQARQPQTGSTA